MTMITAPKKGRTILTRTGKLVHPLDLSPKDIDILDIAWALAGEGRFSNHTIDTYSVAQHSVLMTFEAQDFGYPQVVQYQCLLHDAPEAYLNDVATPVKELFPTYRETEDKAWKAIARVFHCPVALDARVKELDRRALRTELRDLMPDYVSDEPKHVQDQKPKPFDTTIYPWPRPTAFRMFLLTYSSLRPEEAPNFSAEKYDRILKKIR